jgi:hypothetical protein
MGGLGGSFTHEVANCNVLYHIIIVIVGHSYDKKIL